MATKAQNVEYQLRAWCKEYGIEPDRITFEGWHNLNEDTTIVLGTCSYIFNPLHCEIRLGDKFEKRKLGWLETSVLWHEFCHANAALEDGIPDTHNKHWRDYRKRKMKYWIGDAVAKFMYIFL